MKVSLFDRFVSKQTGEQKGKLFFSSHYMRAARQKSSIRTTAKQWMILSGP